MTKPRMLSVVIAARNQEQTLALTLRCLEQQSLRPHQFECIVVDDGSSDGTADVMSRRWDLDLHVLMHRASVGQSEARNAGWQVSSGGVVVFLDADVLPCPGWLSAYRRAFEAPLDGAVSGTRFCIVPPEASSLEAGIASLARVDAHSLFRTEVERQFTRLHEHASVGQYPTQLSTELEGGLARICAPGSRHLICAHAFIGANVAVRRRWLERTGGFDAFMRRNEDVELGFRLWEAGCRFGWAEGARTYHLYHDSDRHITDQERHALFLRHPYNGALALYLWMVSRLGAGGALPGAQFESLDKIANTVAATGLDPAMEAALRYLCERLLPQQSRVNVDELVRYIRSELHIPPHRARRYVECACRDGLISVGDGDRRLFDLNLTRNWLRARSRRFGSRQPAAANRSLLDESSALPAHARWRGTYIIDFSWEHADPVGPLSVEIPIHLDCATRDTRAGSPAAWQVERDRERSWTRLIVERVEKPGLRATYGFECCSAIADANASDRVLLADLTATYTAPYLQNAHAWCQRALGDSRAAPAEEPARRIYSWVIDRVTRHDNSFADTWVLESGLANELQIVRLFVNLCRLAGIPARERRGAWLSRRGASWVASTVGCSPLAGVWAEVLLADASWHATFFADAARRAGRVGLNGDPWPLASRVPFIAAGMNLADGLPRAEPLSAAQAFVRTRHHIACDLLHA